MKEFLELIDEIMVGYNQYVGSYLLLFLLVPTGIFFGYKFKFIQLMQLGHAFRVITGKYDNKKEEGDVNHFKALSTALSATVGTGNIVGVALAIYYGGHGAIFWMWVTGFLGMTIKLVECTLSTKFRKVNADGSISGGPMYYMEYGLKDKLGKYAKVLAMIFAIATILCSFGTGNMAQSNSITDVINTSYGIDPLITSIVLTVLVLLIIVGGIQRIANVTSKLVPLMAVLYFFSSLVIIIVFYKQIPGTLLRIVTDAFTGTAATGGFIGSSFIMTLTFGISRGIFSNEAGQGSAPIAHAAAKTKYPAREGLVASIGPLIDTLIICTLTALVILMTGAWKSGTEGVGMTVQAFEIGFDKFELGYIAKHIVSGGLLLFAFSTIIGWSYYGSRAVHYVFKGKSVTIYYYVYAVFVFLGGIWGIDFVWHFVDMVITFMTIPNLIAILLLFPVVKKEIDSYFKMMKIEKLKS